MKRVGMLLVAMVALVACRERREGTTSTTGATVEAPTALDQSNDPRDLAIARDVRVRLTADPTLTAAAKNAIVVVRDGVVTLRAEGVEPADRTRLLEHVAKVPGVVRIDDRLGTEE